VKPKKNSKLISINYSVNNPEISYSAGTVIFVLADDRYGGRHQRFITELKSGQTLLISHNIDLTGH